MTWKKNRMIKESRDNEQSTSLRVNNSSPNSQEQNQQTQKDCSQPDRYECEDCD